ncbi:MAG: P-loop NTPase [Candidatus Margulisbacteria bacterium]|nr:P-loop NTPase [Candidatus Margulisiibacteriota bacterium]
MKQITVISGKGGTGKTTLTACLSQIAKNIVVADCDVDAADLHLLLFPKIKEKYNFFSGKAYKIDTNECIKCNKCRELCRFNAINDNFTINRIPCDGCGACYYVCPVSAISETENCAGVYYISSTENSIPMIHASLHTAEDNSGKLVAQVRKEAKKKAEGTNANYILIDGPPGIGCPVNAAIVGVDLALIVTEPTLSGIHDLKRIIQIAKYFNVKSMVIVNKYDINLKNTEEIENICHEQGLKCIAKIPYDEIVVKSLVAGKVITEFAPDHEINTIIKKIWEEIK